MTKTELLLREIDDVFPSMKMPASAELICHQDKCYSCAEVKRYLDAYRGMEVDSALIGFLHQELYHLSPIAFRWMLPYYLKICLSSEGIYSQEETYFLVYNLSPDHEFQAETYKRLSALNLMQVTCLIHFLEWCSGNKNWIEIYSDVAEAIKFLNRMLHK